MTAAGQAALQCLAVVKSATTSLKILAQQTQHQLQNVLDANGQLGALIKINNKLDPKLVDVNHLPLDLQPINTTIHNNNINNIDDNFIKHQKYTVPDLTAKAYRFLDTDIRPERTDQPGSFEKIQYFENQKTFALKFFFF